MKINSRLILIVCIIVNIQIMSAQFEQFYENWRWAHFTTSTGLPSDIVDDIIETDDGIVWASTFEGLAWYDGFRWNKILEKDGLPEKHPTRLNKGHNNTVLVVIDSKLYIGNSNGFNKIEIKEILKNIVISVCAIDSDGIFISTDNLEYPFIIYRDGVVKKWNLTDGGTTYCTKNKKIYIVTAYGLFAVTENRSEKILEHCYIRSIVDNKNDETIMAVDAPYRMIGLWEWQKNGSLKWSKSERLLPIRSLDISSTGEVIVAYETGDVRVKKNGHWKSFNPVPKQMVGLKFLKYDSHDNLWVGTEGGLYYFRNTKNKWNWWTHDIHDPRNIVMEIFKDKNGDVWIGNGNGIEIHKTNGKTEYISHIQNKDLGLITGINSDEKGHVWISSGLTIEGAYRWDGKRWTHFGFNEGLKCPRIHKIKKDIKGHLWFLGLGENGSIEGGVKKDPGAFMYDGKIFYQINTENGLLHNRVYSFIESETGALWFGTKKGLSRKDKNGWKHFDGDRIKNMLSVYAMALDKKNNLWFSNFTSQLCYVDQNDSIHREWSWLSGTDYRQKVWDIKIDNKGIIWVATTQGLFSYFNGSWNNYDFEADYKLKELRVVLPLDNKIYVGGHGIGVGILDRNDIGYAIKAEFLEPIIEYEKVRIRWHVDAYWGAIPFENIEVRYQLDNKEWSDWIKSREVVFEGLQEGNHSFILQAKDIYGNIQVKREATTFKVPPPFYKNPTYFIPLMFLVGGIIFLSYKNIQQKTTNVLKVRNQRIRFANDLHDDVGSNLGSIALISQRIKRNKTISKEVKEDITIISETAIQSGEYLRDIVWYITPRNDNFRSLETRLREIARRMLKSFEVQFQVNDEVQSETNLSEIRRDIVLMFKEMIHNIIKHSKATSVSILFERKPDCIQLFVRDNGVGFEQREDYDGNGMRSLRTRAENNDADLNIKTKPGEGTAITIKFKYASNV